MPSVVSRINFVICPNLKRKRLGGWEISSKEKFFLFLLKYNDTPTLDRKLQMNYFL